MDMLKKLKSLFIIEEGELPVNASETGVSQRTENEKTMAAPEITSTIGLSEKMTNTGAVNPKFMDILMKAIEENNLEGIDYLEFKTSLQSLSKMNMDDATRYQSAMAMAHTLGASPEKILQSANHYLEVLDKENDKFRQAVESQKAKLNQDQVSGVKTLEDAIVAREQEIAKLTREIEEETEKLKKLKEDILSGAARISETSAGFTAAYNHVKKQITDDISLIKAHASKV